MPNLKSAIKRMRQNRKKRIHNKSRFTAVTTAIKKVTLALSQKNKKDALVALSVAIPLIDKAASKHLIHRNNASRKISRLTHAVHSLA